MINKKYFLIYGISMAITLSGCNIVKPFFVKNKKKEERKEKRFEKKLEKGKIDSVDIAQKDTIKHISIDTALAQNIILFRNILYNTLQLKTKMHYESNNDKQSFTANFRLKKDSIIWATIQAPIIGEVARAIVTPDSVKAIDRFNKKYFLYSYNDIQKLINLEVDFTTLQDIIVGNSFATVGKIIEVKNLNPQLSVIINNNDYTNQLTYNMKDTTLKQIQLQTTRTISKSSVLAMFNKFDLLETHLMPVDRSYFIQDVKGAAQLNVEVNKMEINNPEIDFPFSIPSNYKRNK